MSEYIIAIDLGTTNCTMSYLLKEGGSEIHQFAIPQPTNSDSYEDLFSLPSFLYLPFQEEIINEKIFFQTENGVPYTLGTFAKKRGQDVPSRVIHSAKSWLSCSNLNRREDFLPLEGEAKLSPVSSLSHLLKHLKEEWNEKMEGMKFNDQEILITVPASFDPSARQLILEAASLAGYPDAILLEEPQAAFYAWLNSQGEEWRKELQVGDTVLVVDIGGGTTDFSLILVGDEEGNLILSRQAVGSHLLLGGDNIDLTLAHFAKGKFEAQGKAVDEKQMQALVHSCREAKELFFGENPPEELDITLHGRGSGIIGSKLKCALTLKEVSSLILDGFFPILGRDSLSPLEKRYGIQEVGLPFAQDARVTCQLSRFLSMSVNEEGFIPEKFVTTAAVLFNGGTMKAKVFEKRLEEILNHWREDLGRDPIKILKGTNYDYAVSLGAAYYGLSRHGKGIRIKAGTSRTYFVGVEEARPAVPGIPPSIKAICIAPFGMEEGSEVDLRDQEFALVVGEETQFRFFSKNSHELESGLALNAGSEVKNWQRELLELHPIETILEKKRERERSSV